MYRYWIYGGTLDSELELPDIPTSVSDMAGEFTVLVKSESVVDPAVEQVAEQDLGGGVKVRLERLTGGLRFVYSDTGMFDVTDSGRLIVWRPAIGADERLARIDLLGRVLAAAIHLTGAVCLHGSAVSLGRGSVGFLGEKGRGKSTIAMALTGTGVRLIADDTLAIQPGPPARCLPGVQRVRLRSDAAEYLLRTSDGVERSNEEGRILFTPGEHAAETEPTILEALYVLVPHEPGALAEARRERMTSVHAAVALLGHSKLGPLQGTPEVVAALERARLLVETIPVYRLDYPRDLERIGDCADRVLAWHR